MDRRKFVGAVGRGLEQGQAMLKLRDGEFHGEYDLVEMTQTWFEPDGPRHSKPIYRKVDTKIMQ